jgi:hypothetical protein
MKIGILTTDTPHHRYFIREIARCASKSIEIAVVVFETAGYSWDAKAKAHFRKTFPSLWKGVALNPYLQSGALNRRIDAFERARFFPDGDDSLPAHIPVLHVASVNDENSARIFDSNPCDIFFVYGTAKIKPDVFRRPSLATVNAHGGLLPAYRGLDTNLWAALLGKPADMAVALHQVEAHFDTGALYAQERIGPVAGLSLMSLRYFTTLRVVDMALTLFENFLNGRATAVSQAGAGTYFGPMPLLQKYRADRVIKAFAEQGARAPVFAT